MSVQAMSWVFDYSKAQANSRLVLLAIANHADSEGSKAWPALDRLARETLASRATVKRALQDLRGLGEVEWQRGFGFEGSRRRSNYYWMPQFRRHLGLPDIPTELRAQFDPLNYRQGLTEGEQWLNSGGFKGSGVSPYPSIEPSLEPDEILAKIRGLKGKLEGWEKDDR